MDLTQENLDKLVADNKKLTDNAAKATTDMATMQTSITGLEDNARLLKQEKKEAKAAAEAAAHESAKKGGDSEALEKSWQEKFNTEIGTKDETIAGLNGMISSVTSGAAALSMASEIAVEGQAEGLLPHIKGRLTTEIHDGKPITRVLDKAGKPSAMSLEDLKTELKGTPYLATMISGSKANGTGDPGKKGGGNGKDSIKRSDFSKLDPKAQGLFMAKVNKGEAEVVVD